MGTLEVTEFKKRYKQWLSTIKYIKDNWVMLEEDQKKKERFIANFRSKYEQPMEEAWKKLDTIEKNRFLSMYTKNNQSIKKPLEV